MSVLVFGKTGQVATELQRRAQVQALGRDAADLADPAACVAAIEARAPSLVINAAAYTAVDKAEEEEALATRINADAPGAMAQVCAARGVPFIHLSTDYVFDGSGTQPWRETDPVSPQNAYGRAKLAGEVAVRAAGGAHLILRTAWVFSAHGSNFVKTMLRLSETRDALDVIDDQIGGPTPAADIAATLLHLGQAMTGGHQGGTYHYAGTPPISWAGFAREIFKQAGKNVTVRAIPTADYARQPARRPLNSRLDCAAITADFGIKQPNWRTGLAKVLAEVSKDRT